LKIEFGLNHHFKRHQDKPDVEEQKSGQGNGTGGYQLIPVTAELDVNLLRNKKRFSEIQNMLNFFLISLKSFTC
jgi:hypothetical protein